MADNNTPPEPEKKGVGAVGGTVALGVGLAASAVTANALHSTAVKWNQEAAQRYAANFEAVNNESAYVQGNLQKAAEFIRHTEGEDPKLDKLNKKFISGQMANTRPQYNAQLEAVEEAGDKILANRIKLEEAMAEGTSFLKKGSLVFRGGDINIKAIVIGAGLSAGLLTAHGISKLSGSHAARIEQEKAASAQPPEGRSA